MTRPDPTLGEDALREVQKAYRDLPAVEPGAALDARVRAAVAAEVASEAADPSGPHPNVVRYPHWRRAALPCAAAAAVLVAIGVNQLQPATHSNPLAFSRPPSRDASSDAPRSIPPTAAAPEPHAVRAPPPPPPDFAPPPVAAPPIAQPAVPGTPPAAMQRREKEQDEVAAPAARARVDLKALESRGASTGDDASAKLASPPPPAAIVARPAPAAAPALPADDASAFADVRQLLAQQRRDEAIVRLKRWRDAHPDAPLPADLKGLETDGHR